MVTKIVTSGDNANSEKYSQLFEAANKWLNLEGDSRITTLNDYFYYLPKILEKENYPPKFVRLPLDEEFFEINANTRKIIIPNSFKDGACVQGDQGAEIIFFSIDRYFDTTDLNTQNIYIEWKAPGEDNFGFSKDFARDIDSNPDKIIFGWVLQDKITKTEGDIEFAVHFYTIGEDEGKTKIITYSLSTLPHKIKINKGLNLPILEANTDNIYDSNDLIINRIKNSNVALDTNAPETLKPVITLDIMANDTTIEIVDGVLKGYMPENEDFVITSIQANSQDSGILSYQAQCRNNDQESWKVCKDTVITPRYEKSTDTTREQYVSYYRLVTSVENGEVVETYEPYFGDLADVTEIYELKQECKFTHAGEHRIFIENRKGKGGYNYTNTKTLTLPYPSVPVIDTTHQSYMIEVDGSIDLTEKLLDGYDSPLASGEKGTLSYQWFAKNPSGNGYSVIEGATNPTYKAEAEGTYLLRIINTLNKEEANTECEYSVFFPATAPGYTQEPSVGQAIAVSDEPTLTITVINDIMARVDKTRVVWYKRNDENSADVFDPANDIIVETEELIYKDAIDTTVEYQPKEKGQYYAVITNIYKDNEVSVKTEKGWNLV